MSYINLEKLIKSLELSIKSWGADCNSNAPVIVRTYRDVLSRVENIPTADVVEVRHGHWGKHYKSGTTVSDGFVSSCCDMWNERETPYCPHCGAKMDGKDEE